MRTVSLCGEHKRADGFCPKCDEVYEEMQKRNPCATCADHTNDEICYWSSECGKRAEYERWRNDNGYNPNYNPDITKKMQKTRLID
jgi:hypothetical protein